MWIKKPTTWIADIRHGKEIHIVIGSHWIVIGYITTTFWQFLLLYQLIHPSNRAQIITDLMALVRYSTFIHIHAVIGFNIQNKRRSIISFLFHDKKKTSSIQRPSSFDDWDVIKFKNVRRALWQIWSRPIGNNHFKIFTEWFLIIYIYIYYIQGYFCLSNFHPSTFANNFARDWIRPDTVVVK